MCPLLSRPVCCGQVTECAVDKLGLGPSDSDMANSLTESFGALAHPCRLELIKWLAAPVAHFPPQVDGDLVEDGVCAVFIARKWGVSQPTASRHLKILVAAGLIVAKRQKGWTFYRRNEPRILELKSMMDTAL